jgi:signal transduction histidine kinase
MHGTVEFSDTGMFPDVKRFWQRHDRPAKYLLAVMAPLAATLLAAQLGMPAFIFEHLAVLLVVALAILAGRGPAVVVAIVASVADNILLREPIGRPAIDGTRDLVDFALFLFVAATVGWLVNRLRVAKEQAQIAARRERLAREQRDELVATVAHDLATPLAAIQGTIQRQAALSALDMPRLFVRIETAAARATSLVRTLRDVRSLEDDALTLNIQRADLRSIIEPTVRMLDRMSDQHPIALTMPQSPLLLDCDVERIGRVVENLLTNAIKYSPDGGPVEVSAVEHGGFAVVEVADCGIGIPSTARDRLFELGYRTENAASVAPGLGLGLYIASAIVRRHAGQLEATARISGGSVFTLRLPLAARRSATASDDNERQSRRSPFQYAS